MKGIHRMEISRQSCSRTPQEWGRNTVWWKRRKWPKVPGKALEIWVVATLSLRDP